MSEANPFEHLSRENLIAICLDARNLREQIAQEIERELESNASYFGLAKPKEKWYGYQDALRLSANIARGK